MRMVKIGKAMTWNVVAKAARFVAGPVAYIIIVRSLGEYSWGVLSVLKSITGIALVIVMAGGGQAILKFLPELRVKGGMRPFYSAVKKLLIMQVLIWLVLILAAWELGDIYSVKTGDFTFLLVLAVGFVIFQAMMMITTNTLQSWYETKVLSVVIIIGNIAYILLLILFLKYFDLGIPGVLIAGGISNAGMTIFLFPTIIRLSRNESGEGENAPAFRDLLKFSLPFVVTGILNQIVWRQSEVLFLGHFTGMEDAGYFELAYRIPQMMLEFIPLSIWPIVMAGISESYSENRESLPGSLDLYYRLLYIIIIPVSVLGFAFSGALIPILYGEGMASAGIFTQLFFIVFSYSFLYTPISMALYVMGKSWVNMLIFSILAAVNLGLDFAFIPEYGLWGAFFPVALVMVMAVIFFDLAVKKFRRDIKIPVNFILRCYLAGLPAALLVITANLWSGVIALGIQIVLGAALLVLGFRMMKIIGEREREIIRQMPIPFKKLILAVF